MKEDIKDIVKELMGDHKGKILGSFLGVLLGIVVILFGFWATLFVLLTGLIGLAIGTYMDKGLPMRDLLAAIKEIFPYGFNRYR
ncbi:hypothetical protein TAMA11512_12620 [Selenomonas sp. TAMA-11512]|uniref:DUF2273 domain-containing protein n=1 Tax=Selenomonas sp. TAMA-11512 TaxID=3095337 RepID=UPI00308F04BB|nr:hypothetical protein TAMA11512_12620 [Selenomonas sp. TAMA-11512]